MQITQLGPVLIIFTAMIFTCDSHDPRNRLCRRGGCDDQCETICRWGTTYNEDCDFTECAKGPGQLCNPRKADCGVGLQCRCNRCHGCSPIQIEDPCFISPCLEFL